MQTVFSKRRRWSTFQVVVFVIFLLFGNLLLLNKTREHYEKDYQLKLGEYKYKQSVLQRELDSAKALRIGGNANDDSPKKTGGVRHAAEDNGGVAQTTTHQPPKQPKNGIDTFDFIGVFFNCNAFRYCVSGILRQQMIRRYSTL